MNRPTNTISPFEEMLAYETLWGMKNQSLKKLNDCWDHQALPSQVLQSCEGLAPAEDLRQDVARYLKDRVLSHDRYFSVCVNGTYSYPARLQDAHNPVRFFYYSGDIGFLETKCVSVVGTRKATPEGTRRTKALVLGLVQAGFTVVSGLAEGIDTAAMTTAIQAGGRVVGVIGTPINHYYPPQNKELQDFVAQHHLLISHVPFYRYDHEPFKMKRLHFPERNETMAALSQATIIVEASDTSGTLIQARACMNQGRKLYILNSCFDVPGLKWPHAYEQKGAHRVRELGDILQTIDK